MAQEGEPTRAGWERRSGLIPVCSGSRREREGGLGEAAHHSEDVARIVARTSR